MVMNNLQNTQLKNKTYHIKKTEDHSFELGDYVWVLNKKRSLSKTSVSMA